MTVRVLGRSRRRRPLEAHQRGDAGGLLLFGAIHGDEPASGELCTRFVGEVRDLDGPPLAIVPVVNPDGLAAAHKDNAAGVDLNRNFAARSWQRDHATGYDPGPAPLSEPESAALAALVEERRPRVIVAVHQPFACVNWDGPATELAARMSAVCRLPTRASIGYPTPGSFGAWAGLDLGLPVVTLELARTVDEPAMRDALAALHVAWAYAT